MGQRVTIPGKESSAQEWKHFFDTYVFIQDSPFRLWLMRIWEKARLYIQSNQWLEADVTEDVTRTPFWKPLQVTDRNWFPLVVQNEMIAPIGNEAARLFGAGSRPSVRPDSNSPRAAKAAKVGADVLRDRMEKLDWIEIEYEGCFHSPLYGSWIPSSYWEIDYTKTVRMPINTAQKCPAEGCGFKTASPDLGDVPGPALEPYMAMKADRLETRTIEDPNNPLVPARVAAKVTHCLTCPDPVPLQDYAPTDEEAKTGEDFFGRPMGEDLPLGDTMIDNVSVYDYFPQNSGLDRKARHLEEHGEQRIRKRSGPPAVHDRTS